MAAVICIRPRFGPQSGLGTQIAVSFSHPVHPVHLYLQQQTAAGRGRSQANETSMQQADTLNETLMPDRAAEAIIRAEKIAKYYDQPSENRIQVLSATDLSIWPGEILALLGPSGSGKSTMLRMLSGLSRPSGGNVYWHGKPISEAEVNVSIVFQSFALFPWFTVLENVDAPL